MMVTVPHFFGLNRTRSDRKLNFRKERASFIGEGGATKRCPSQIIIDFTSASHRPYIDLTSTLHRPYIDHILHHDWDKNWITTSDDIKFD